MGCTCNNTLWNRIIFNITVYQLNSSEYNSYTFFHFVSIYSLAAHYHHQLKLIQFLFFWNIKKCLCRFLSSCFNLYLFFIIIDLNSIFKFISFDSVTFCGRIKVNSLGDNFFGADSSTLTYLPQLKSIVSFVAANQSP